MASKRVYSDEYEGTVLSNVTPRCLVLDAVVSEESGVSFCVVDVTFEMRASSVEISARLYHTALRDVPEGRNLVWAEAYRHCSLSLR